MFNKTIEPTPVKKTRQKRLPKVSDPAKVPVKAVEPS